MSISKKTLKKNRPVNSATRKQADKEEQKAQSSKKLFTKKQPISN